VTGAPILRLWVSGDPAAQGSKAYKGHRPSAKTGKLVPVLTEQSRAVTPWRNAVRGAAAQHLYAEHRGGWVPLDCPLAVDVTFVLRRRPSVTRPSPTVPPDIDKLLRALFDGLTDGGVWTDDSRVVEVTTRKVYADAPRILPGADVTICPAHASTPGGTA